MASFIPRSNVLTQSEVNIFNDSHKLTYPVKTVNTSTRRIVWAIKTKVPNRLGVEPGCGVLDPSETMHVMVSCNFAIENTSEGRIMIEWINTSEGAAKQFCREWFQNDGILRRKNLPIEYDPKAARFLVYIVFLSRIP